MELVKYFAWILLCAFAAVVASSDESEDDIPGGDTSHAAAATTLQNGTLVAETLRLLHLGDSQIDLRASYREATLILGLTGAGKTTITQLVSGNNSALYTYDIDGVYLIRDAQDKISVKSIVSKTIFPDLVIDDETNSALYDCPGFGDTRNASVEIANSYFINKVVGHLTSVKFLLVVSHSTVKPGFDRTSFKQLIHHMLQFLQRGSAISSNIAVVVTRVESPHSEDRIIKGVAGFIKSSRSELNEISFTSRKADLDAIFEVVLQRDASGGYPNIRIFRQPEDEGVLSEMPQVQQDRRSIRQMLFENAYFGYHGTSADDFGFPLTADAKLVIYELLQDLKRQLDSLTLSLPSTLNSEYQMAKFGGSEAEEVELKTNVYRRATRALARLEVPKSLNFAKFYLELQQLSEVFEGHGSIETLMGLRRALDYIKFLEATIGSGSGSEDVVLEILGRVYSSFAEIIGLDLAGLVIKNLPNELNRELELSLNMSDFADVHGIEEKLFSVREATEDLLNSTAGLQGKLTEIQAVTSAIGLQRPLNNIAVLEECVSFLKSNATILGLELKFNKALEGFLDPILTSYDAIISAINDLISAYKQGTMEPNWDAVIKEVGEIEDLDRLRVIPIKSIAEVPDAMDYGRGFKFGLLADALRVVNTADWCVYLDQMRAVMVFGYFVTIEPIEACLETHRQEPVKSIYVFAISSINIDADFKPEIGGPDGPTVFLLTPTLVWTGDFKIDVSGEPGRPLVFPAVREFQSSGAQLQPNRGESGDSGGAGGKLFVAALHQEVTGTGSKEGVVRILANGGQGGGGQPGPIGMPAIEVSRAVTTGLVSLHPDGVGIISPYGHTNKSCCKAHCDCTHFEVRGAPGAQGGPGGEGGPGGPGGKKGYVEFLLPWTFNNTQFDIQNSQGPRGLGGPGGPGGEGALDGPGLHVYRHHEHKNTGKGATIGASGGAAGFGLGFLLVPVMGPFGPVLGAAIGAGVGAGAGAGVGHFVTTPGELEFGDLIVSESIGPPGPQGAPGGDTGSAEVEVEEEEQEDFGTIKETVFAEYLDTLGPFGFDRIVGADFREMAAKIEELRLKLFGSRK